MCQGLVEGMLVLPEHKATEPFIDADDIAQVTFTALTTSVWRNQVLELTGPELLSFEQCVEMIARQTNQSIAFQTVKVDDYVAGAVAQGMPEQMAWLLSELFVNVLDGRNQSTTTTIEKVLGRPAKTFAQYLQSAATTGVWNTKQTD